MHRNSGTIPASPAGAASRRHDPRETILEAFGESRSVLESYLAPAMLPALGLGMAMELFALRQWGSSGKLQIDAGIPCPRPRRKDF